MRLWMEWMAVALFFIGAAGIAFSALPPIIFGAMMAPTFILSAIYQWRNR